MREARFIFFARGKNASPLDFTRVPWYITPIMEIIDAHMHYAGWEGFREVAEAAGHVNTPEHIRETFRANCVVMAIAMGAGHHGPADGLCHPGGPNLGVTPDYICYCAGVESEKITPENTPKSLELFEAALRSPQCVGLKFYPGYSPIYPGDPRHFPFYELAGALKVPVVFHTGDTAGTRGLVKYSHPLGVDEVAVRFPQTTFVLAHYGNPWIVDATEVAAKNENVFIDLSGLAAGKVGVPEYLEEFQGYVAHLKTWMAYLADWEKFLYGSDFPLVSVSAYIGIIKALTPAKHWENVFYNNALRVFPKVENLVNAGKKLV